MPKKTLRIFLSYASEQRNVAEEIEGALVAAGHTVFFDKKSLLVGEEYNLKIYDAIKTSDLMVFLVSPDSIEAGSYARTELMFAQEIWKNPDRRVFPILVRDIDFSEISNYLKSVTVLKPVGNISAEVVKAIDAVASDNKNKTILEITEELNKRIKKQEIEERLSELDRNWEQVKGHYTLKANGKDTGYVPSTYLIGIFPLAFGIIFSAIFSPGFADGSRGFFTLLPLIVGIGVSIYTCKLVKEFRELGEDYERERESIQNGEFRDEHEILHL